jgi:flagellin-like protein
MNYKKFMKNSKAISPIFATLILIAIAVIAGVVVYMFVSGTLATMTSGGVAGTEKITVQSAYYSGSNVTLYLEQTGGPAATVNGLIIKDSAGNTVGMATGPVTVPSSGGSLLLASGQLTTITGTIASLSSSTYYTATVTTVAGGSFVSPSFQG